MSAFPSILDVRCSWCGAKPGDRCTTPTSVEKNDVHKYRFERYRSDRLNRRFIVRIKTDDPRFEIRAGDEFLSQTYWLDPGIKVTLLQRLSDGYNPECNVYYHQADFVRWEDQ